MATPLPSLLGYFREIKRLGFFGSIKKWYWTSEFRPGRQVGEDVYGNRYYENRNVTDGRQRFVEFAKENDAEATQIPPEWHSWLHRSGDLPGERLKQEEPIFHLEHKQNLTGTARRYTPHRYILNPSFVKGEKHIWNPATQPSGKPTEQIDRDVIKDAVYHEKK
eukprot:TRINITY_DN121_c0_g3_i1.p1 TRINITY_DN121_c0_g3~~TRINITY_DN121_c0_g3_i1.p1  ORF type:complete len:164 (-),score=36.45 TRINITY_DN121_c0_g3_i1:45-536(-)